MNEVKISFSDDQKYIYFDTLHRISANNETVNDVFKTLRNSSIGEVGRALIVTLVDKVGDKVPYSSLAPTRLTISLTPSYRNDQDTIDTIYFEVQKANAHAGSLSRAKPKRKSA